MVFRYLQEGGAVHDTLAAAKNAAHGESGSSIFAELFEHAHDSRFLKPDMADIGQVEACWEELESVDVSFTVKVAASSDAVAVLGAMLLTSEGPSGCL